MPSQRAGLPPVPDRRGEPRPPPAPRTVPGYPGWGRPRATHHDPDGPAPPAASALGPPDEPPLESVAPPRWDRAGSAAVNTGWLTLLVLIGILATPGVRLLAPVTLALLGVFVVVVFTGQLFDTRRPPATIVAGAHWVGVLRDAQPVRLYELEWVTVGHIRVLSDGDADVPVLRLTDGHAAVQLEPPLLEANPDLWALVYHGIRHSVAAGATAEPEVRHRLGLDPLPPDRDEVAGRDRH